ncbi:hypothetical protein QWY28_09660 [Nocardioides sp. SOB77]|uniref:Uncharacterized protein n=1 Tax=Nocardioides oceani TaxID=3058369 RepID=A0ABT8FEV3_9ACTN|nr:hypothetical protein [Nocardioides oceani]MDN4173206.1 hypothetical protein [Nocardioides oceani]
MSPTSRTRPVQRWVPVVDEHGRTRLESRWSVAPAPVTYAAASAAA